MVTKNIIIKIIAEYSGKDVKGITEESSFDDLGLDSLDMIDLTLLFEEIFDITIPHKDTDKMRIVRDIILYFGG